MWSLKSFGWNLSGFYCIILELGLVWILKLIKPSLLVELNPKEECGLAVCQGWLMGHISFCLEFWNRLLSHSQVQIIRSWCFQPPQLWDPYTTCHQYLAVTLRYEMAQQVEVLARRPDDLTPPIAWFYRRAERTGSQEFFPWLPPIQKIAHAPNHSHPCICSSSISTPSPQHTVK